MKVAGLQTDIAWEDPAENFRRAGDLARQATDQGARLIVLPEMFATGFTMNAVAAAKHAAETRSFLAGLAGDLGAFVAGGFVEPGELAPFARGAIDLLAKRRNVDLTEVVVPKLDHGEVSRNGLAVAA